MASFPRGSAAVLVARRRAARKEMVGSCIVEMAGLDLALVVEEEGLT